MAFLRWIAGIFCYETGTPEIFSCFHIVSFLIFAVVTALVIWRFKDCSDRTFRRLFLIAWITLVVLEIYRDITLSLTLTDTAVEFDFSWYSFPFQLCSSPLYVFPFIVFLKDGAVRRAAMAFVSTFALFGGLVVMIYPGDVYISYIGISIQSMIHHGSQAMMGIFCTVHNRKNLTHMHLLSAIPVFCVLATVAQTLNITVHMIFEALGRDDTFNMFFISPYHECTLPLLSEVYKLVPYPVFLMIYIIGFALVAAIIYYMQKGIITLVESRKSAKEIEVADA